MKLKERWALNRMKVKWNKPKLNKVCQQTKRKVSDHTILPVCYVMFTFSVQHSGAKSKEPTSQKVMEKKMKQTMIKMKFPKPNGKKDDR